MLKIFADSNESTSPRPAALAEALERFKGKAEFGGYAELPVDYQITDGANSVWVEVKEIPDYWSSKCSGHLGSQILSIVASGQPGFVAVFGSAPYTLQNAPRINQDGYKGRNAHITDITTAQALSADAMACNVPIQYLFAEEEGIDKLKGKSCGGRKLTFVWVISMAKEILEGARMASWLPRFDVDPQGYSILCSIHGLGDVAAKGLLSEYSSIANIVDELKRWPENIAEVKVNGRKLGQAKAEKLRKALGVNT